MVLLAETMEGYHNLCQLVTISHGQGFYHKPRIDNELLRQYSCGLIGLSACMQEEISQLIKQGDLEKADEAARQYRDILGQDNFFLEIQNSGLPGQ